VGFKCVYELNVSKWIKLGDYGIVCLNGFDLDVWCILFNFVNYDKSHL